jgi:hypothetical protein
MRLYLDAQFLIKLTLALNSAPLFWKLLVSQFILGKLECLLCSMSSLQVKTVACVDVVIFGTKIVPPNHIL